MPMLKGAAVEELYRRGARGLAGGALERQAMKKLLLAAAPNSFSSLFTQAETIP